MNNKDHSNLFPTSNVTATQSNVIPVTAINEDLIFDKINMNFGLDKKETIALVILHALLSNKNEYTEEQKLIASLRLANTFDEMLHKKQYTTEDIKKIFKEFSSGNLIIRTGDSIG